MDKINLLKQAFNALRVKGIIKTQKDFANLLGCNEASISRALKGDDKYLTDGLISKVQAYMNDNISATPEEWIKEFQSLDSFNVNPEQATIPVIPTGARAGTLGDFVESVKEYDCERIVSPIKGADYAIQVTGDSMSPEIPNGSQILIKKIWEVEFVEWGKIFCLDTKNGAVIKRIYPTDNPEVVECRSINPDYPPFKVNIHHINGWYRVLMVLSLK